jgi:2-hydroxy-3-oxopropionate reductase
MNIGFCGAGLMGSAMVRRLLAHGHRVSVWNRSPDKARKLCEEGASFARSPAETGNGTEAVMLCLTDELAVELRKHSRASCRPCSAIRGLSR